LICELEIKSGKNLWDECTQEFSFSGISKQQIKEANKKLDAEIEKHNLEFFEMPNQ
jgi:hypothetical protein